MAAGHPSENQPFLAKRPAAIVTSRRTRTRVVGSEFLFGFLFASSKPSCRTNHNECGTAKRALAESQFGGPMSTSLWYLEGLSFHDDCKRTEPNEHSEDADVVHSRATSVVRDWSIRSIRSADISLSNRLLRSPSSRVSSWSDVFFCLFVFSFFFCPLKVERYRHAEPMARLRFGEANAILAVGSVAYLTCKFDYAVPLPFPWKSSPGGGGGWDCVSSSPSAAKKKERQRSLGWLHQPTDQGNRPRWLTVASKAIGFRSTQTRLATAASDRSLNDTLHDLIERVDLQQVLSYETRGIISRHGR